MIKKKNLKILALVPARSGSKKVKHKNIKLLNNKPLISYSIEHAKKSLLINRCIVSTDSEKYAKISRKYGAETPFLRPKEISGDNSTDLETFEHALKWLKQNEDYIPDIIVHLRPTAPIRDFKQIDRAITMLIDNPDADSVRSVIEAPITPYKMWRLEGDYLKPILKLKDNKEPFNSPRQILPKIYWQNANIDVTRANTILNKKSMTGNKILACILSNTYYIDIDVENDFKEALRRIKNE